MKDSVIRARINVKSLAAEAKIIRKEIDRVAEQQRWFLRDHKVNKVRPEARLANLALGFLKNKPHSVIERTSKPINVEKLTRKISIFTLRVVTMDEVKKWLET